MPAEWRNEASGEAALDLAITLMKPDDPERIGDLRPDVWDTGQDVLVRSGVIEEGDTIEVNEALDDSLIEEINDWDRAEVEAAAEEYEKRRVAASVRDGGRRAPPRGRGTSFLTRFAQQR